MQTKSKLMLTVLAALAIGISSAFARGGDDLAPPPACDDKAVDGFCGPLAKHGADDVVPEGRDDFGVDFILMIARHGADDVLIDDNGVDLIPG
jgi:hypothetical protein